MSVFIETPSLAFTQPRAPRDVVIKYPGSCHDSFIFANSTLKQTQELDPTAGFLFGDSGYGLSSVIITPYSVPATPDEIYFNRVQRKPRSEVKRCIGRIKNRWRCLLKSGGALQYTPTMCCSIILTCVLLENMCYSIGLEDPDEFDIDDDDNNEDDDYPDRRLTNQTRLGMKRRVLVKNYLFANPKL
ncbi:putative nuclease HARBI1 [Hydra vulgaris]|uniref:putative nuclease HARBI1 n=1 Tax=Hydra vulgaris TaxID=6087 RepID=UPI0032EA2114